LIARYGKHDQVTRLVCVEGWSQIGQWSGLRFADFMAAYPPMPEARWIQLRSKYNIATDTDDNGNDVYTPDPYYVSIEMETARHPQTLLATEQSGQPLNIGHGAPLRLRVPMKLGLKNLKAISSIHYSIERPPDYWSDFRGTPDARGYSHYDGI
jgi:DMSO/TMAO reductase YedYZ molybdopterin-dependent catalytic subunit